MSDGDAVLISGPEEGPDVCSLGCGQGFPVAERDGGSITTSSIPSAVTTLGAMAATRVLSRDPGCGRNDVNRYTTAPELRDVSPRRTERQQTSIGWGLLGLGFVGLVVAVIWIHYTSLPPEQDKGI